MRANDTRTLPDGLGLCTALGSLRLNFNDIPDCGTVYYARALTLCSLVLLDLSGADEPYVQDVDCLIPEPDKPHQGMRGKDGTDIKLCLHIVNGR